MASKRIDRINTEIKRELSILLRNIKDPRVNGLVSITGVSTTGDLRYCQVYVSMLNRDDEKNVLKGLQSASGWLRRELGMKLNLRYTPELVFHADDSISRGAHILDIINGIERKEDENDI